MIKFLILLLTTFTNPASAHDALTRMNATSENSNLKKMAAYNTWANQQLANWVANADSAQWHQPLESSFPTLELTVRHLWNAEKGWLSTLQNAPWTAAITAEQTITTTALLDGFLKTSSEFQWFVESMNEADFQSTRPLGKQAQPIDCAGIIQHVFNHATYHRGQLITMGRQVGLPNPPRTDYIFFLMLQE